MSSQTTSKALPILIVLVVCCCVSSVTAGGLWAGNVFCDTSKPGDQAVGMNCAAVYERSPAPAPAPAPAGPTDPRSAVWSTGQLIQGAPLEVNKSITAPIAFTTFPQPAAGTPTYTMSIDINVAQGSTIWRAIMQNGAPGGTTYVRQPWVNVVADAGALRLEGGHTSMAGAGQTLFPVATGFGTWFNYTFTVNSTAYTAYINGTQVGRYAYTAAEGPPTWKAVQTWEWSGGNTLTSIQVANTYFWPSVLTPAQIAQLKVPSSPTPGVATTALSQYTLVSGVNNNIDGFDVGAGYTYTTDETCAAGCSITPTCQSFVFNPSSSGLGGSYGTNKCSFKSSKTAMNSMGTNKLYTQK